MHGPFSFSLRRTRSPWTNPNLPLARSPQQPKRGNMDKAGESGCAGSEPCAPPPCAEPPSEVESPSPVLGDCKVSTNTFPDSSESGGAFGEEELRIATLANQLEHKIAVHGERALECAPAYVEYAAALLRKAQAESDPFGSALQPEDSTTGNGNDRLGSATAARTGIDIDEESEEGEPDDIPENDDLELAFQCFEVARLIFEQVLSAVVAPVLASQVQPFVATPYDALRKCICMRDHASDRRASAMHVVCRQVIRTPCRLLMCSRVSAKLRWRTKCGMPRSRNWRRPLF